MKILKKLFKKGRVRKQTTFCYCPSCNNELISSGSFVSDKELVTYECNKCEAVTEWLFDAPVPLLIYVDGVRWNQIVNGKGVKNL